jgi:two-component system chemotaxis response regulator CheB
VAVGASTGGPQALQVLLQSLPADAPGLLIVQHMQAEFTTALARRLNKECEIEVKEAEHGDRVLTGRALIAPGDRHMIVRHAHGEFFVSLRGGPRVSRHRPSVDVLFESVAAAAGGAAVGVLLTGMGSDGADALGAMKKAGAVTIAQDEESCVVFGMPAQAISRGVVDEVVSLDRIGSRLLKHCGYEWSREPRSQVMGG